MQKKSWLGGNKNVIFRAVAVVTQKSHESQKWMVSYIFLSCEANKAYKVSL